MQGSRSLLPILYSRRCMRRLSLELPIHTTSWCDVVRSGAVFGLSWNLLSGVSPE